MSNPRSSEIDEFEGTTEPEKRKKLKVYLGSREDVLFTEDQQATVDLAITLCRSLSGEHGRCTSERAAEVLAAICQDYLQSQRDVSLPRKA